MLGQRDLERAMAHASKWKLRSLAHRRPIFVLFCSEEKRIGHNAIGKNITMNTTIVQRAGTLFLFAALALPVGYSAMAESTGDSSGGLALLGDEPDYVGIGAGAFNIQGHTQSSPSGELNLEIRGGKKWWNIGPVGGVVANADGGIYGYAGGYADITFDHFVVTPLAAVGAYSRGGSQDLGGVFQFRLALEAAYQFDSGSRAGVEFAHISNAGIDDRNPGENELLAKYSIPLDLGL
jgi:hypothetical protein